jgi:predicted Zn-dependent protease
MKKELKAEIEPEFNRASSLWKQNKTAEAINIFKQLDKTYPEQPTILGMLGAIYLTNHDFVSALAYFQKIVKLSPKSELASTSLFHCLMKHEQFDAALSEARKFIKRNGLTKEYELLMAELDDEGRLDNNNLSSK